MKILGSNEELTESAVGVNPNPNMPATAPILGERNPLDAAVAAASGASPPHFVAQVNRGETVRYQTRTRLGS